MKTKDLFTLDKKPVRGLIPVEWAVLIYTILTSILMMVMYTRLHAPAEMTSLRIRAVVLMAAMWAIYRMVPCRLTMLVRVAVQIYLLADWYPDTYEFNRCFSNLDHIFCGWEQSLFSCQPSIEFSRLMPWGIVSELLDLGYVSYYPIIVFTAIFYFIYRNASFDRAVFVIMGAFFAFYVLFIFIPVAGPTFYFRAVGLDLIHQGIFPAIGNYFETHSDLSIDCLPSPGWRDGLMWKAVELAKWAGERPTAAFPSSHVGITTVCMLLLYFTGNRKVFFYILPLAVLMFFATFYIQAHYAIDAIVGLVSGVAFYFLFNYLYTLFPSAGKR